jgi:hypothetical protein
MFAWQNGLYMHEQLYMVLQNKLSTSALIPLAVNDPGMTIRFFICPGTGPGHLCFKSLKP